MALDAIKGSLTSSVAMYRTMMPGPEKTKMFETIEGLQITLKNMGAGDYNSGLLTVDDTSAAGAFAGGASGLTGQMRRNTTP